jgi:hypothetical protein
MSPRLALFIAPVLLSLAQPVLAQCSLQVSGSPQPELSGTPFCSISWDPDGVGPLPPRLVVGGDSLLGGAQLFGNNLPSQQHVMTWDGSVWVALGDGPGDVSSSSVVTALASWNGVLVAGGSFSGAGGVQNIARWDGVAWQPLGNGFPYTVTALTVWNGNLVVVGGSSFTGPQIRTWNGVAWTSLPTPPLLQTAGTAIPFEGELCVAGSQAAAGSGVIERWNGSSWATPITTQGSVLSLSVRVSQAVGGTDTLFVGGGFTSIGGAAIGKVAQTNGGPAFAWNPVGGGLTNTVTDLHVRNSSLNGYVLVVLQGNVSVPVLRYTSSNSTWTPMGITGLQTLTYHAGSYHGVTALHGEPKCQRYDGSNWVAVRGPGINGEVRALTRSGNDMILGGTFATISGVAMNGIARWDGNTFMPLGSGMVGSSVEALVTLDNGDILAGGNFVAAGGTAANHIARWNGTAWSAIGSGFDAPVYALCKMPNGDVIAGGAFTQEVGASVLCSHVARWNGTAWSPMHFGVNNDVLALVVRSDGTLIAGGRFTQTQSTMFSLYYVARWTGSQWAGLGTAMNAPVHGLAARPNGDIVAVGEFTQASLQPMDRCARWNGSAWVSMGAASGAAGIVRAVWAMPNGDVIAGRGFHQPTSAFDGGLSRWNGSTWSGITLLTGASTNDPVQVKALAQRASGDLVIGGIFNVAARTPAYALASLQSSCMPSTTSYGSGCSSAAGPLVISADTLPWLGAAFRTTTTGLAANSLCFGAIGFSQVAIPLASLVAEGQPGCTLLAAADIAFVLQSGPGTAHSSFALTNTPALLGVTFYQQTIPLEFGGSGALSAVRSSNALAATIGTL